MLDKKSKIYIAGHKGMVGSACWNLLLRKGYKNLIGISRNDLDLRDQNEVNNFFKNNSIDVVIDAAAKVGGILANDSYPYEFLLENMQIQNNLINSSVTFKVKKFIFLGSSCIYPKLCDQPIMEEYLLTDSLEPTNEWYALAKITGVKLVEALRKSKGLDYISLMPTNLYGYNDNFDLKSSHVIPALIKKFHLAKQNNDKNVSIWGSGRPMREFLFVDDLAEAILLVLENKTDYSLLNVGYGSDISIKDLAIIIKKITKYNGQIIFDSSKPDGTPKKLLNSSKINSLGFKPSYSLEKGLELTYNWYKKNINES